MDDLASSAAGEAASEDSTHQARSAVHGRLVKLHQHAQKQQQQLHFPLKDGGSLFPF